ncbi:MAG: hypothetical protein RLZZ292_3466, partial [Bacteroidota bacterium]
MNDIFVKLLKKPTQIWIFIFIFAKILSLMAILSGIGIENFRVFKEKMYFEFAPLTILTGANNAGKSTVLKALLLLRDSKKDNTSIDTLDFSVTDDHKLGGFEAVKNNLSSQENIGLELKFNIEPKTDYDFLRRYIHNISIYRTYKNSELDKFEIKAEFKKNNFVTNNFYDFFKEVAFQEIRSIEENELDYSKDSDEQLFKKIETINVFEGNSLYDYFKLFDLTIDEDLIENFGREIIKDEFTLGKMKNYLSEIFMINDDNILKYKGGKTIAEILHNIKIEEEDRIKYKLLIDIIFKDNSNNKLYLWSCFSEDLDNLLSWYYHLGLKLELCTISNKQWYNQGINTKNNTKLSDFIDIDYIAPVRANQQRIYTYTSQGTNFNQLLVRFTKNHISFSSKEFINKWIGKEGFNIADEIQFVPIETYGNGIKITKNGKKLELADLGFGATQLIPLLMQIAINQKDYILLEEPENSLHPNLQSKLADMLIDAQQTFGVRFIIETHSEYLIRRLAYLTGKGQISSDYTSIYYFYEPERIPKGRNQVEKITIQKDGSLDNDFGSGFFDEADNLSIDLYN